MGIGKIIDCIDSLKNLVRTGWMQRGVSPSIGETVASHSFETSIIAGLISEKLVEKGYKIDVWKTMSLALLHDFMECGIGDVNLKLSLLLGKEKENIESKECRDMFGEYPRLEALYREWISQRSLESIIARISDKLSTYLQAKRYYEIGFVKTIEIIESSEKSLREMVKKTGITELEEIITMFLR